MYTNLAIVAYGHKSAKGESSALQPGEKCL